MLTLKFYAGADDAPPRLPVRVLTSVRDARLTDDSPPRLALAFPPTGLSFSNRDDVLYEVLNGAVVEVFDGGSLIATLNAGPEVLTIPAAPLSDEERRRMAGAQDLELDPIGLAGGPAFLAQALRSDGFEFRRGDGGVYWDGPNLPIGRTRSPLFDSPDAAVLSAEAHLRKETLKIDVSASRDRIVHKLDRARVKDGLRPLGPVDTGRELGEPEDVSGLLPVDLQSAGFTLTRQDLGAEVDSDAPPWRWRFSVAQGFFVFRSSFVDTAEEAIAAARMHFESRPAAEAKPKARIFPPVPDEDWLPVDQYPASWATPTDRVVVMIRDDDGNVARAYGADGTWWLDHGPGATPYQTDFDPTHFSYLPDPHRFACRVCWSWLGRPHVEGCPSVPEGGEHLVIMGDTPPATPAPEFSAPVELVIPANPRNAAWFEGAMKWAEGLIVQLPATHDGRNSWLLNHGLTAEAVGIQDRRAAFDPVFAKNLAERRGPVPRPADAHHDSDSLAADTAPAPRCVGCEQLVGEPHNSTCPASGFVGDTVKSADTLDAIDQLIDGAAPIAEALGTEGLVDFTVDGKTYDTTRGVRPGRSLYDRVGDLSGRMLVDPAGKFVGDTDLVDIQGGEVFATTTYRDDTLRPVVSESSPAHTGAFAAVRGQAQIMVDGRQWHVAAGRYTGRTLKQTLQVAGYDLSREPTPDERAGGARGLTPIGDDDTVTVADGMVFSADIPF